MPLASFLCVFLRYVFLCFLSPCFRWQAAQRTHLRKISRAKVERHQKRVQHVGSRLQPVRTGHLPPPPFLPSSTHPSLPLSLSLCPLPSLILLQSLSPASLFLSLSHPHSPSLSIPLSRTRTHTHSHTLSLSGQVAVGRGVWPQAAWRVCGCRRL